MSTLPESGATAPTFTLSDNETQPHRFPSAGGAVAELLFFVKHDCATCAMVAPVIEQLHQLMAAGGLRVLGVSQSDPDETTAFLERSDVTFPTVLDQELEVSDRYGFDAVPALVLTTADGTVIGTVEGWAKSDWHRLLSQAAATCQTDGGLGSDQDAALAAATETLPESRPGCGSRAHDPDVARRLAVARGRAQLASRRVRIPVDDDPFEFLFERGLTDGLPVVPPTEARVIQMLSGTPRAATEVVATVPPNLTPVTVEKVAVNAVMAGCRPEYLPVVLAAIEAACSTEFNLHGVLATTYFAAPVIVVNGPIRREIGLNCEGNVFGQGSRANATIGRAVQLVVRNVGGGKPGEVDMATLGQPGKYTCCIGEYEEASCWDPLHVERGFEPEQSTVTVFAGEAPRAIRDQLSRHARSLATSIGLALESVAHVKLHSMGEAMLVVSPEHVRTFERERFSKDDLRDCVQQTTGRPLRDLLPDSTCEKGVSLKALPPSWLGADGQPTPEALERPVPKFARPEEIIIVVAGGTAGKFSAVLGGWASGAAGSTAVTIPITV